MQPFVQHAGRCGGRDPSGQVLHEPVEIRSFDAHHDARIGAELADAQCDRLTQAGRNRVGALGHGPREQEDGIDAAHLGVDGNRRGAGGGGVEQGPASAQRSGEADRLDLGMPDERQADVVTPALHEREEAGRHVARLDRSDDGARDQFGRAGVGRVGFAHDRAAGRERGGRVAARHREREREVAGREDRHGPDRNQHAPQIRLRQRRACRIAGIDPGFDPGALGDHVGEQTELADRAAALALEPAGWQPGFGAGSFDERRADRDDLVGDGAEQARAVLPRARRIRAERGAGGRH